MNIFDIPAFTDNYIWALQVDSSITLVDPGDAAPVIKIIKEKKLKIEDILITHHHFDHTGGLVELKKYISGKVYGPKNENINGIDIPVTENDLIETLGIEFLTIETPGHTLDHVSFYGKEAGTLFCGDTLFSAGCGRLFEGTYEQLYNSIQKLNKLPDDTKIYCGHEYTLSNLKFALEVDKDNKDLMNEFNNIEKLISSDIPSLPTNLNKELKLNPFLRCHDIDIKNKVIEKFDIIDDELQIFTALRKWKDNF